MYCRYQKYIEIGMNPDMVQHVKIKTTVNEVKIKINEEIGAAKYFEGITCVACMKFFQKTVKNQEKYNCKEFKRLL